MCVCRHVSWYKYVNLYTYILMCVWTCKYVYVYVRVSMGTNSHHGASECVDALGCMCVNVRVYTYLRECICVHV